jgi:formylglycine-generating enzyme required for sulfatase activity
MANTSALGLALATAAALISTSGVVEAPAGEGDHATAPSRQISGGSSAPEAKTTGRVFVDCSDGCPQMVEIPSGRFLMGSKLYEREQPLHPVSLDTAIAVGRFETTFDEWDACVRGGGCVHNSTPSDEGWGRGRRPVIDVSWNDAKDYVSWLSRKTGKPYRLLSEAEWEYAARAGSTTTYSWGDEIDCGKASYDGGRGSDCAAHTGRSFTTCSEMSGSGARTTGTLIIMARQKMARRGVAEMRPCASCAAGRGTTARARCARPTETGSLAMGALPSWASVSRGNPIRDRK